MKYKYSDIPNNNKEIVWVKLIKIYDLGSQNWFPKDFQIGDKTWVYKDDIYFNYKVKYGTKNYILIENNRYGANFEIECFEIISGNFNLEPQYEIY